MKTVYLDFNISDEPACLIRSKWSVQSVCASNQSKYLSTISQFNSHPLCWCPRYGRRCLEAIPFGLRWPKLRCDSSLQCWWNDLARAIYRFPSSLRISYRLATRRCRIHASCLHRTLRRTFSHLAMSTLLVHAAYSFSNLLHISFHLAIHRFPTRQWSCISSLHCT